MARLWNFFDGEPYLDNPRLLILNPKGKRMRRRIRRRPRTNPRRHRRSYRRNSFPLAGMVANPHRRRRRSNPRRSYRKHFLRNPRRRHYRRNPPDILGFNLQDVAFAGAAVIASPFIEKQILGFLPASISGTTYGRWGVKVAAAAGTGYLAKRFLGPKAGNLALIALGANLIADAVTEFAPSLTAGATGYYTRPNLGYYPRLRGNAPHLFPARPTRVNEVVIDRLNPAARF